MATDYEKFYQENPHGLGEPTKEFVGFFDGYHKAGARVLDIGCGQGRDALFIARLGYRVVGVDHAASGVRDLLADAREEELDIEAHTADIRDYIWGGPFDVIVIDRTLHMLKPAERGAVLEAVLQASTHGSHLLIADERANLPAFKNVLAQSKWEWAITLEKRGCLFVRREN